MGRWTQFDEDVTRLPEGFKTVEYNDLTERYTFLDTSTGDQWESEPRVRYGGMTRTHRAPHINSDQEEGSSKPSPRWSPLLSHIKKFEDIVDSTHIGSPEAEHQPSVFRRATMSAAHYKSALQKAHGPNKRSMTLGSRGKSTRRQATVTENVFSDKKISSDPPSYTEKMSSEPPSYTEKNVDV